MHTDFSELSEAAAMSPVGSYLVAERHVAWDWASNMDWVCRAAGRPVRWFAELYTGADLFIETELTDRDALYRACEVGESIHATDADGNKLTPTVGLA